MGASRETRAVAALIRKIFAILAAVPQRLRASSSARPADKASPAREGVDHRQPATAPRRRRAY